MIGRLPLDITIREKTDSGNPVVASEADSAVARAYLDLADKVGVGIQQLASSQEGGPTITVSDD